MDCFAIASVLALSWIFLKIRYKLVHYVGVIVSLVGVACLVIADYYGTRYYGPGMLVPKYRLTKPFIICVGMSLNLNSDKADWLVMSVQHAILAYP